MNLVEAEYPGNFDIEYFKNLPSYKKRIEYAKENLGKLGAGSGRIVFEIDDNTVFKLARNQRGTMQNDVEADLSEIGYDCIAKVFERGPGNLWIESEKAKKINKSMFKKLTGFNFEDWGNSFLLYYREVKGGPGGASILVPDDYDDIVESELFSEVFDLTMTGDIMPGDFTRISSWGIVERDGQDFPVIIDYGISKQIWNDFYVKSPK